MPQQRYRDPTSGREIEWDGYRWVDITQQRERGFAVDPLQGPDPVANRQVYANEAKQLGADRLAYSNARDEQGNLDRFRTLNREQGTGGWLLNTPGISDAISSWDSQINEMGGIASQLQGRARPVGSGATSDYEQRLYRQGVPSPEKPGPVNGAIIERRTAVRREEADRLAFREEFFRHNGTLSGADEAWTGYVSSNPYLVTGRGGTPYQNNRRLPWREYFGLNATQAGRPARGSSRDNPVTGLTDVQIQALPDGTWARRQNGQILRVGARKRRPEPPTRRNDGWSVVR